MQNSTSRRERPRSQKTSGVARQKKQANCSPPKSRNLTKATLKRETFRTSREMDFLSLKELVAQTGHDVEEWPLVALKELLDNALDACEEADIAPEITVEADANGISVCDNGPGLADCTIKSVLDFSVRVSNREAYVAPDRGAQGNALKTLTSMPYVVDPEHGRLVITSCGKRREIRCGADPITQRAVVHCDAKGVKQTVGSKVGIQWGSQVKCDGEPRWPFDDGIDPNGDTGSVWYPSLKHRALMLLRGFTIFNPHLSLKVKWFKTRWSVKATDPSWKKWRPNQPTSPHWYGQQHLERLIGAYIALDRERGTDRTVAAFVGEFDGLTGSQKRKKVLEECRLQRVNLSELATENGFKTDVVAALLKAMKAHTKPVKPARLGIIGREHFLKRLVDLGCDPKQFEYAKKAGEDNGLPYVLESVFGWLDDDADDSRRIFAGANWSAAINNPFRSFGSTGEGLEAQLSELKAGAREPIVFGLHLAHPRIQYTDRGKSAVSIDDYYMEEGVA